MKVLLLLTLLLSQGIHAADIPMEDLRKKPTVVFDIDKVLFHDAVGETGKTIDEAYAFWREHFPKAYTSTVYNLHHVLDPFASHVLASLIQRGITIAFFSSGIDERNEPLIQNYLVECLGRDVYDVLKTQGQFSVFSRRHMSTPNKYDPDHNNGKGLAAVGFHASNSILVDDIPSNRMEGEETMIWLVGGNWANDLFKHRQKDPQLCGTEFYTNFIFHQLVYTLGVIHMALDLMDDGKALGLREAVKKTFPKRVHPNPLFEGIFVPIPKRDESFAEAMIGIGFEEIQKLCPDETLSEQLARLKTLDFPVIIPGNPWGKIIQDTFTTLEGTRGHVGETS